MIDATKPSRLTSFAFFLVRPPSSSGPSAFQALLSSSEPPSLVSRSRRSGATYQLLRSWSVRHAFIPASLSSLIRPSFILQAVTAWKMILLPCIGIAFVQTLSAKTSLYPKEDKSEL